jgi:outer membrane lipoprotein-sorting protein
LYARALAAIFLLLLLFLSGCAKTGERLRNDLTRKLEKVNCYYAEVKAEVFSTEGTQSYFVKQWWQETGRWRVEVDSATSSQIFVCDGKQIFVYQRGGEEYDRLLAKPSTLGAPPFSLMEQLELFLNAKDFSFEGREEITGNTYYVVSFAGLHRDEAIRLWLDTRTLFPVRAETSLEDELLSRITLTNLEFDPALPDALFSLEQMKERKVTNISGCS